MRSKTVISTLLFSTLIVGSMGAQVYEVVDQPLGGAHAATIAGTWCYNEKPSLSQVPNYPTSTYATFTGQIAAATHFAATTTEPSLMIWDLTNQVSAPIGSVWGSTSTPSATNRYFHPSWTRKSIGDVFGVTLDNHGNIYVASTRVYGTSNVGSPSIPPAGATPGNGDIYRIDGVTGAVTRFVQTHPGSTYVLGSNKLPNTNTGLGNLHYAGKYGMLYVANIEDGLIYRIAGNGTIASVYDHGAQLNTVSPSRPVILDDKTNGATARGRRPFAVTVYDDKLYYSIWWEDEGNPESVQSNEVWSIDLNPATGAFLSSPAKLVFNVPPRASSVVWSNPVTDISFSTAGRMSIAERTMTGPATPGAHYSRQLEYSLTGSTWVPMPLNTFEIGPGSKMNSAGGTAYDNGPNGRLWTTGDALVYLQPVSLPHTYVYGLQGTPVNGGSPSNSILVDLDDETQIQDDKRKIGDVEIPCVEQDPVVEQTEDTLPTAFDPCCPPVNKTNLSQVFSHAWMAGMSSPYTLLFQNSSTAAGNTSFNNVQTAYLQYLALATNQVITQLDIDFTLWDSGTILATPNLNPTSMVPNTVSYKWTWASAPAGPPFFPTGVMQPNHWYTLRAIVTAPQGPERFFPGGCVVNLVFGWWIPQRTTTDGGRPGVPVFRLMMDDGRMIERSMDEVSTAAPPRDRTVEPRRDQAVEPKRDRRN